MSLKTSIASIRLFLSPLSSIPKSTLILYFTAHTLIAAGTVANVLLFRQIMIVLSNGGGVGWIQGYLLAILWIVTGILLYNVLLDHEYNWGYFYYKTKQYIANTYLPKFIRLDNEEVGKYGTGRFISIIESGSDRWGDALFYCVYVAYDSFLLYIFSIILVWFINPILVIPAVLFTVATFSLTYFVNNRVLVERLVRRDCGIAITRYIVRIIMEKFTILKNDKTSHEMGILNDKFRDIEVPATTIDRKLGRLFFGQQYSIEIIKIVAIIALLSLSTDRHELLADISALLLIANGVFVHNSSLIDQYKNITRDFVYVESIHKTITEDIDTISGYDAGTNYKYTSGSVAVRNISFSYKTGGPIFTDFSLDILGGKKIAIVGKSGSGKSTIIKLILGFVRPQSWAVIVDGQDLSTISLKSFYKHVGYLSQEPAVFDGTVYENLTYGIENGNGIAQEVLEKSLRDAQCEFVFELPDGLETEIGEKGVRLSGWERQRLAIARLFLERPDIIILDEPTSALDSFSESKISQALELLSKDKTLIVIAHRLQTVKNADIIIVLGKNTILERGTHAELLAKNGSYAAMVDLQSGSISE